MRRLVRFAMMILVAFGNVGLCILALVSMSPRLSLSMLCVASCWVLCCTVENLSCNVGLFEDFASEALEAAAGAPEFGGCPAVPDVEFAEAVLRVLNENFFGGLNELRVC
jgi:hypothetical protein